MVGPNFPRRIVECIVWWPDLPCFTLTRSTLSPKLTNRSPIRQKIVEPNYFFAVYNIHYTRYIYLHNILLLLLLYNRIMEGLNRNILLKLTLCFVKICVFGGTIITRYWIIFKSKLAYYIPYFVSYILIQW